MTKVAARELAGFGIRVNSVHPGGVLTRMVVDSEGARSAEEAEAFLKAMPLGRFAEPAEISRLVAYLASDESSYSTGQRVRRRRRAAVRPGLLTMRGDRAEWMTRWR